MRKETLFCDMCGEKSHHLNQVVVLLGKKIDLPFDLRSYDKYKAVYNHEICDKCVGSEVFNCYGDTPPTSIKDKGMSLLKKLFGFKGE